MLLDLDTCRIKLFISVVLIIRTLFPVMVLAVIITDGPGIILFLFAVKSRYEMENTNRKK